MGEPTQITSKHIIYFVLILIGFYFFIEFLLFYIEFIESNKIVFSSISILIIISSIGFLIYSFFNKKSPVKIFMKNKINLLVLFFTIISSINLLISINKINNEKLEKIQELENKKQAEIEAKKQVEIDKQNKINNEKKEQETKEFTLQEINKYINLFNKNYNDFFKDKTSGDAIIYLKQNMLFANLLIQNKLNIKYSDIKNKNNELKNTLIRFQTKNFPKIRKNIFEQLFNDLRLQGIFNLKYKVYGDRNEFLSLIEAGFASDKEVNNAQLQLKDNLNFLRFQAVCYKWIEHDQQPKCIGLTSKKDNEL